MESKSQSTSAVCWVLFELSILYLLQRASKLIEDPGNLFLANIRVSTTSLLIIFFPIIFNSLLRWDKSNSALCIINLLSFINSKKLSTISGNFFLDAKNSSVYPWTCKAFSETFLSGFK